VVGEERKIRQASLFGEEGNSITRQRIQQGNGLAEVQGGRRGVEESGRSPLGERGGEKTSEVGGKRPNTGLYKKQNLIIKGNYKK